MFIKRLLLPACLCLSLFVAAQNVAINTDGSTPDLSSILDVSSTTKGLLIPRMTLAERNAIVNPAYGLLIFQMSGTTSGLYCNMNSGSANWVFIGPVTNGWTVGGNTLTATGSLGTISNNHIDLMSNNTVRGRMTNLGEFFWGATNTTIPGDLMGAVGNTTFPWALSGYTSFNGAGVYGAIQAGTSQWGAVLGEYTSTTAGSFNTSGVRGINGNPAAGTGFRRLAGTGPQMGIVGEFTTSGSYKFGVYGGSPSISTRTAAVFGDDAGIASGALGYYASNGNDYSVYGFGLAYQAGVVTGRVSSLTEVDRQIGLGINGGVMGGWVNGLVYGMHVRGAEYGLYVDGKTFTNEPIVQLVETANGDRIPTYTPSSMKTDVYARGKSSLENGSRYISFDAGFNEVIAADPNEIVITVTPNGNSNGVYVSDWDAKGFWVKENNNGHSNVSITWIAIGTRKETQRTPIPGELLSKDFDNKMRNVMHNDNDDKSTPQPIWWDGTKVRFDTPPPKEVPATTVTATRAVRK